MNIFLTIISRKKSKKIIDFKYKELVRQCRDQFGQLLSKGLRVPITLL
jgi:hypothetical protein